MNLGLEETVALVAGSSRGIGRATAEAFLKEGARVVLTGRTETDLDRAETELSGQFGADRVASHLGDLTDPRTSGFAVELAYQRWGRLDSLVLNVGSGAGVGGATPGGDEWRRIFDLNLWGSVNLVEAALPRMLEAARGTLVFVGSIAGMEDVGAPLPYGAAKAAVARYAAGLARSVGPQGLRVNCVAPGNILFPGGSWERRLEADRDGVLQAIARNVPLGRLGEPKEIAGLIVFLCSEAASFITGSLVVADGGQTRGF